MDAVRQFNHRAGISLVATLLLGTEATGLQAQQGLALPPTVLEAFAARPDTKTAWSKFIGRLEGPTAYAIISAVALESASSPRLMRGIRIELRHEGRRPDCNQLYADWTIRVCARYREPRRHAIVGTLRARLPGRGDGRAQERKAGTPDRPVYGTTDCRDPRASSAHWRVRGRASARECVFTTDRQRSSAWESRSGRFESNIRSDD